LRPWIDQACQSHKFWVIFSLLLGLAETYNGSDKFFEETIICASQKIVEKMALSESFFEANSILDFLVHVP